MISDWSRDILEPIEQLIDRWTAEGNHAALDALMPAWRANSGLTDGWHDALAALRALPDHVALTTEETTTVSRVAARIEWALTHRG